MPGPRRPRRQVTIHLQKRYFYRWQNDTSYKCVPTWFRQQSAKYHLKGRASNLQVVSCSRLLHLRSCRWHPKNARSVHTLRTKWGIVTKFKNFVPRSERAWLKNVCILSVEVSFKFSNLHPSVCTELLLSKSARYKATQNTSSSGIPDIASSIRTQKIVLCIRSGPSSCQPKLPLEDAGGVSWRVKSVGYLLIFKCFRAYHSSHWILWL